MRTRSAFPLLLAAGILAAQLPSSAAQDKNALKFVRTAADVATNVQSEAIDRYIAIYIDRENWKAASTDNDLGPFIQAQEASPTRSMACLFSQAKTTAVCVYFDGARADGVAALKSDRDTPFTSAAAVASYKSITREMLRKAPGKLAFSPMSIILDNGQRLDAYQVKLGAH
ncbi:MAG: hypothetical protein ABSA85_05990 [Terracidiphilus sp.]|jgi:hypothetical protein